MPRTKPERLIPNIDLLAQKNITLQGSFSHNWPIWERVIALLSSGQFDVKPIIGGVWPVTDWHEAFEDAQRRSREERAASGVTASITSQPLQQVLHEFRRL